jgi:hypothetical protein
LAQCGVWQSCQARQIKGDQCASVHGTAPEETGKRICILQGKSGC